MKSDNFCIFVHARCVFVYTKTSCNSRAVVEIFAMLTFESNKISVMKENRADNLHIRISKKEKEMISSRAGALGVSISTYLRKLLLQEPIISKTDIQTVFEIKKIGVNLNQLAKHINTLPIDDEIRNSLLIIENYINELKQITERIK